MPGTHPNTQKQRQVPYRSYPFGDFGASTVLSLYLIRKTFSRSLATPSEYPERIQAFSRWLSESDTIGNASFRPQHPVGMPAKNIIPSRRRSERVGRDWVLASFRDACFTLATVPVVSRPLNHRLQALSFLDTYFPQGFRRKAPTMDMWFPISDPVHWQTNFQTGEWYLTCVAPNVTS